jgi:DNA-directed RNA polymerase beta subunit
MFDSILKTVQTAVERKKQAAVVTPAPVVTPRKPAVWDDSDIARYDDDDDGEKMVPVGVGGLLAASEKLLAINQGLIPPDERDSLKFKRVKLLDHLLKERIRLDVGQTKRDLVRRAARVRSLQPVHAQVFDKYMTGHIIGNPLSMPLEEINPMHLVEQSRRITQMGMGGIGDSSMITLDAQMVHPSQFFFISPSEGPESEQAGIDTRLAWGAKYGSDGRLYQKFYDRRAKKYRWMSPSDLDGLTVKVPD